MLERRPPVAKVTAGGGTEAGAGHTLCLRGGDGHGGRGGGKQLGNQAAARGTLAAGGTAGVGVVALGRGAKRRRQGRGLVLSWGGRHHQHRCLRVLNVQSLQLVLDLVRLQVLEGLDLGSEVDGCGLVIQGGV